MDHQLYSYEVTRLDGHENANRTIWGTQTFVFEITLKITKHLGFACPRPSKVEIFFTAGSAFTW